MKSTAHAPASRAFSLVELLVVIAVIAIVAGFAVPAVTTMLRGSQLTQGSQMVVDQIALARQTALSKNRSIEVRFYKYADPETPGEMGKKADDGVFRAIQTFEILDNGKALPINTIQRLPTNVLINEAKNSTLINELRDTNGKFTVPTDSDPEIPDTDVKREYVYVALRFLPDGSTNLPPAAKDNDSWYITIHGMNVKKANGETDGSTSILPDNFFTLQIDPITGSTRSYRPNIGG